jgi:1,4-dihydroxy-2-naphthoate octaprenyltransferase
MEHGTHIDIRSIIEPLHRGKFWMQLLAIVSILYGVLLAITVIGLIVAWIPIWAGVVLMQAAGASSRAFQSADALEMRHAMAKLKTYFTIFGVLMLIGIILMVISMIFGIGAGLMGLGSMTP